MRERAKVGYPLEGQDLMLTIRQVRTVGPKEKTALHPCFYKSRIHV